MDEKRKPGRPRIRTTDKTGLQVGDKRATFVIRGTLWDELRNYQNTSTYRSVKDLMNDMITKFLEEKKVQK